MKLKLLVLLSSMFLAFAVHAGGEGCSSKKGHSGKDMSAEMKEFKGNHAWLFSESEVEPNPSAQKTPEDKGKSSSVSSDDNLVEI